MIIVKSNTIYVSKNYNVTGLLRLVVKDRATDEEIVFDNLGDDAFPGSSYHILTIDVGRLEPSTEYEYTLIGKDNNPSARAFGLEDNNVPSDDFTLEDTEKIIGRGLLRTE